jgi:hypothetical protein
MEGVNTPHPTRHFLRDRLLRKALLLQHRYRLMESMPFAYGP